MKTELKTLKDLEITSERESEELINRISLLELDKPIALRKRKEIDNKTRYAYIKEIKEEAIKWYKRLKEVGTEHDVWDFIKTFFDLNDGDLK